MNIFLHNLKVAVRNLMKYKLQTAISVLTIAVGIVTLALVHSMMTRYRLPDIFDQPYSDRAYEVSFKTIENGEASLSVSPDLISALKGNGGLRNAEKVVVPNGTIFSNKMEFQLSDSSLRKGEVMATVIDPEYPEYAGHHSAITGEKIRKLKAGEAIIAEDLAKKIFQNESPVGRSGEIETMGEPLYPITIIDVFQSLSSNEPYSSNNALYYCETNNIEEYQHVLGIGKINVLMMEGATEEKLINEINTRIDHLGLEAELSKVVEQDEYKMIVPIKMIVYAVGSLILLAAIIGFLRIEFQMFYIRRREMALRIVNGANRRQVFNCLLIEIVYIITLSVILALLLGNILQCFIDEILHTDLNDEFLSNLLKSRGILIYSIVTGGILIVICGFIAWISLFYIGKSQHLETSMRKRNNHMFRNIMLCFQIVVCICFVSSSFILIKGGTWILKVCNVPEDDSEQAEYLYVELHQSSHRDQLSDEIKRLPELADMINCYSGYTSFNEIMQNPEIKGKLQEDQRFMPFYKVYFTNDTTLLSSLGIKVEWLQRDINRNESLLIGENAYKSFEKVGLLDKGTLSFWNKDLVLPIAGIIKKFPYDMYGWNFVAISDIPNSIPTKVLLVPKKGKGKSLMKSVEETIVRIDPELLTKIVCNYRENENTLPFIVESARSIGWILGGVSILICAMSIFSTIALDTRGRRKEVAIRKVNGAKSKDIYRMFGRVYAILIIIALAISIPLCILFNRWVENYVNESVTISTSLSPVLPIILGSVIVIVLILMIVGWQIYRVMQVGPAKIIAKE